MKTNTPDDRFFILLISIVVATVLGFLVSLACGENIFGILTAILTAFLLSVILAGRG